MREILPIAAIALLLGASKGSTTQKRKIRVTYDCYRGCAMDNPFGSGCWVRDYDWTVTASIPAEAGSTFTTLDDAERYRQQIIQDPNTISARIEPRQQGDRTYYRVVWLSYDSKSWLTSLQSSTSKSWSFSNPEAFYAEQAQKMIANSYEKLSTSTYASGIDLLPLSEYEPEIIYTKEFNECVEKDMNLNILADFVRQWVINYLTGGAVR